MTEPWYKWLYRLVVGYNYEDEPETVCPPSRKPPPDVEQIDEPSHLSEWPRDSQEAERVTPMVKAPTTRIKLLTRDQQTVLAHIDVSQTFEPYEVIFWQGDPFIPTQGQHDTFHEALFFWAK